MPGARFAVERQQLDSGRALPRDAIFLRLMVLGIAW
jgi:hypothetical protein